MMPIEQQLTSLELSMRLKELGVKQGSYYKWSFYDKSEGIDVGYHRITGHRFKHTDDDEYAALSPAEVGEMLPGDLTLKWLDDDGLEDQVTYRLFIQKCNDEEFSVYYDHRKSGELCSAEDLCLANALAKLLIWLLTNKSEWDETKDILSDEWKEKWLEKKS